MMIFAEIVTFLFNPLKQLIFVIYFLTFYIHIRHSLFFALVKKKNIYKLSYTLPIVFVSCMRKTIVSTSLRIYDTIDFCIIIFMRVI